MGGTQQGQPAGARHPPRLGEQIRTLLPNYHYEDLSQLYELYAKSGLANPAVIIDTNHSNSGKQWDQQARIAKEVLHSTRHNGDIGRMVKGLMIESYLLDGCQKPDGGVYGLSITDPCIGWEKTEQLVLELAELRGCSSAAQANTEKSKNAPGYAQSVLL